MATTIIDYLREERKEDEQAVQPKWQRFTLLSVLAYEASGALVGGSLLIAAPDGRYMNMPVDIMHGAFPDFLVPGIILFGLGMLNAAAFVAVLQRMNSDWFMSGIALGGLAIWFWIEIAILLDLHWLHFMWGVPVIVGGLMAIPLFPSKIFRYVLLSCGILSSLLYVAINIIVPTQWDAYDPVSQTISELSAVDAPTRTLWLTLSVPYTLLITAFAWAVWKCAEGNRLLRIAGGFLIAYGVLGIFWPLAPMHLRETLAGDGATLSDAIHIALGAATEILYILALVFAALALGKTFRIYSIVTFTVLLIFGVLTFLEAPGLSRNEPTPLLGIWERINIGSFLIWVVVLAIALLTKTDTIRPATIESEKSKNWESVAIHNKSQRSP